MHAHFTLAGHCALVTGASRGIGRAIARRLAAHGAAVAVVSSPRSAEALHETCAQIEGAGGRALALVTDLADAAERSTLVARAQEQLGPIDILVNNAAANSAYVPPSRIDRHAREALFNINLQVPIDLIQQALPAMRQQNWGRIVNLSSEMARQPPIPYPGSAKLIHALALYGCAKAALERYTLALAAELQGSGVHVNAVMPYKIAHTEAAQPVVDALGAAHPDWIEPVEMMAEAAYRLIDSSISGWIAVSREVLQRTQSPLHALDGCTVLGDALTLDRDLAH